MRKFLRAATVATIAFAWFSHLAQGAPLLHYAMEEGSGTTTADSGTGTPAPGTLINSTWSSNTPGAPSSAAIDTSGASSASLRYVTAGDVDKLDGLSGFTLTTWLNLSATPNGNRRIMSKQAATTFDGFSWNVADPGNGATRSASAFGARLFVGGTTGFTFDGVPSNPSFVIDADNKWAFVAVTYDGTSTSNNVNYYYGTASGAVSHLATTTVNAGPTKASSAAFNIGHTDAAPTADTSIPGLVDDARVYGSVLSLSELEDVRQANVPEPAGLIALAGASLLLRRRCRG